MRYATVDAAIRAVGLVARGAFHPGIGDAVPALPSGSAPGTLVLLGNAGPAMWTAFAASPEHDDGAANALDRWSERIVGDLARTLDAHALFPFGGPPWLPFLAWARRAEPVRPSPLGMLIHPEYGLWHAYRGALAFAPVLELPPRADAPCPCDACEDRPCLSACPVGAFTVRDGYDVGACVAHVDSPAGGECAGAGCLARRACPIGVEYRYSPAQSAFHMAAFLRSNRRAGGR